MGKRRLRRKAKVKRKKAKVSFFSFLLPSANGGTPARQVCIMPTGEQPSMTSPLLEVIDLHKRYGPLTALGRINFHVLEGEMFGLLGPNGAGKTTLLSILSSLSEPTSGTVRILEQPITRSDREVRRLIGIVPQELAIYNNLTARENLIFFGELFGLGGPELNKRVGHLLAAVGLDTRANHRVHTFSGGMKRRLNLAAALVHAPKLLLLDEPTVGVDPQSRNLIFEEVRRLNKEGLTVVYTSHYMEEVEALCTRIGIIDHGELKACDTLPQLLKMLRGLVRSRVSAISPALLDRARDFPDCRLEQSGTNEIELHCADVNGTLVRLVGLINEIGIELLHLETEEANLERVFLHLTGRQLRD
jgi:ABC-2 type transport system ATP-binding protein